MDISNLSLSQNISMKKFFSLSILFAGLFLTGCDQQSIIDSYYPKTGSESIIKEDSSSKQISPKSDNSKSEKFINKKYWIEFAHPDYLKFEEDDTWGNPIFLYSISATYKRTQFMFYVINKERAEKWIETEMDSSKNIHLKDKIKFKNWNFIWVDRFNPWKMYFMDAYYIWDKYIYQFQSIKGEYSKEMAEIFENMISTFEIK